MAKRILVVEDDRMLCQLFEMFVKDLGHELVGVAQTDEDAFAICETDNPDVILMDIHLKNNGSGIEAARTIHQKYDKPVIYITSDAEPETVRKSIYTNTYGFLVKPIYKASLGLVIELAYYKHRYDKKLKIKERKNHAEIDVSLKPVIIVTNGTIEYANWRGMAFLHIQKIEKLVGSEFDVYLDESSKETWEQILSENKKDAKLKFLIDSVLNEVSIETEEIKFNKKRALKLTLTK